MKREVDRLYVADIVVSDRHRAVDEERVKGLAESFRVLGQQTPISVWTPDNEAVHLIVGRHRLEAAKLLGWDRIDGVFVNMTERQRRMWEISENLHRSELSALERAEQIAEWIRLASEADEDADAISSQLGTKPGRPEGGVNAAARNLGIAKTEAHRAADIAAMDPDAKKEAERLSLSRNQDALADAARHATKEQQIRALREAAAKRAARQQMSASEKRIEAGVNAVKRLSAEELEVFDDWYKAYREDGGAVFDKTKAGHALMGTA